MGDIGPVRKRREYEPMPTTEPVPERVPEAPASPEPSVPDRELEPV